MSDIVRGDIISGYKGSTLVSGSPLVEILGPFNWGHRPHKSFTIYNVGPVTLSGAMIRINPDPQGSEPGSQIANPPGTLAGPNAGLWENYDTTSFQSLPAGTVKTVHISTATARWWDVAALNDRSATITVTGYAYAVTV